MGVPLIEFSPYVDVRLILKILLPPLLLYYYQIQHLNKSMLPELLLIWMLFLCWIMQSLNLLQMKLFLVEAIKLIFIIQTSAIDVEVSYTHDIKLAELTYCTITPYDYISNNFTIIYCIQIGVACVSPIRPAEMDHQSELLENSDRLDTTHIQILNNNKFAVSPIIPPQKVKLNLSAIIQDVRQLAKILWSAILRNSLDATCLVFPLY
ncbi:Hypothetical_protein [Hexamita inflata]|uniref:Hypothetical_protein n=1 Tax=Hexamita inflata TaxID=28002 RepID=A0AA86NU86_9EUKA|nr:Hypothetical protein HINF_LOCUS14277 [Hexamita inflata]